MDDWNSTHPDIAKINTIITELTSLEARTGLSASDKQAIGKIREQYETKRGTLETTGVITDYLRKATAVYSTV